MARMEMCTPLLEPLRFYHFPIALSHIGVVVSLNDQLKVHWYFAFSFMSEIGMH